MGRGWEGDGTGFGAVERLRDAGEKSIVCGTTLREHRAGSEHGLVRTEQTTKHHEDHKGAEDGAEGEALRRASLQGWYPPVSAVSDG
jgi:hypothetical protein